MTSECLPIQIVPGLSQIFLDYCAAQPSVRQWYGSSPLGNNWQHKSGPSPTEEHRRALAHLLTQQNSSPSALQPIQSIGNGAGVVVTGQQVGLFGGPLYTPHKAATAIALARQAVAAGQPLVPIFWLAGEDHDFAEVNHVIFPDRHALRKFTYEAVPLTAVPVGKVLLDDSITSLVEQACDLLGYSDATEWLAAAYQPGQTFATAFAQFYAKVFAQSGLLIFDASGREAHRLGAAALQAAIERADELHSALVDRNRELLSADYHAQVTVAAHGSLLFLIETGTGARLALKRTEPTATEPGGLWQAGRQRLSTPDLLAILESEPERISPSALLRPIFQDTIFPTSAYVGGPAEIAYFAQSAVLYERILGRLTPVLPRLSATLVEPAIAKLLDRYGLSLETILQNTEESLAQRLGARAIPIEGKQKLASAGNALESELVNLTEYMTALDAGLGRSAGVAASKMLYQMNRLRRLAANFELQKETSLGRNAQSIAQAIHPHGNLQERVFGAAYFLARYGNALTETLIQEAADSCPGHKLIQL